MLMVKKKTLNMKKYWRKYRDEHKDIINAKGRARAKEKRDWIREYKKDKSCFKCGYNKHIDILEFHHLRDKKGIISSMKFHSKKRIIEEMAKCILICPNCHRWLHWEETMASKEKFKCKL